jgi:NAD(P)-dependent dehydrogenase (short-subunit alcohol dehydrogenase family)
MQIEGSVALVTGANRGLGRAYARALAGAGAAKVYAAARDPRTITDPGVIPVRLDVTDRAQVAAAAELAGDVSIVVNNAGAGTVTSFLDEDPAAALAAAREMLEVNYLGTLSVSHAFAPVLAANGGGALVNMQSVLSWVSVALPPFHGPYSASKAAAWSLTNALRVQLRGQGTLVVGVHAGLLETDLAAGAPGPKTAPEAIAAQVVAALAADEEQVLGDQLSRDVKSALSRDLELLYPGIQEQYDAAVAAAV